MVGQQFLALLIEVRILDGQPMNNKRKNIIKISAAILILIGISFLTFKMEKNKVVTPKDKSVSVWDTETFSFKKYPSYAEVERERQEEEERELSEYNEAMKGTILEQVQNIDIPAYDFDYFKQLQDGKVEVYSESPMKEGYPDRVMIWKASLEKNLNSFVIGDFNGDKLEDVAHIIGYTGGGSGYFYYLTIFENKGEKLEYLAQVDIGDRVVINGVRYESGNFLVDIITQGEGDEFFGYCCPNTIKTIKLKLEEGVLLEE